MDQIQQPSQGVGLCSLPVMLLHKIIQSLSRKELKCLRLTDRNLNGVVSGEMFRSLSVEHTQPSVLQLQKVAESPSWSEQVNYFAYTLPVTLRDGNVDYNSGLDCKEFDPLYKELAKLSNVKGLEILEFFVFASLCTNQHVSPIRLP